MGRRMAILSWGMSGTIRTEDLHLAVLHFVPCRLLVTNSTAWVLPPPHLGVEVFLADPLALEGRAEGHGDVDLGNRDLEAPDFDGLLAHLRDGARWLTTCS